MYQLKSGSKLKIEWGRPLVSRADGELSKAFDCGVGTELTKIRRRLCGGENGACAVLCDVYFSKELSAKNVLAQQGQTLSQYLEEALCIPCKVSNTEIQLVCADQVLSGMMGCALHTPLVRVLQTIKSRGRAVCVCRAYVGDACTLSLPGASAIVL